MFGLPVGFVRREWFRADRDLKELKPDRGPSGRAQWIDVAILADEAGVFCEIHTRFLAYRAGRQREASLRPLRRAAEIQRRQRGAGWGIPKSAGAVTLRLGRLCENEFVDVLAEVAFDSSLEQLPQERLADAALSVALVTEQGLSRRYACRIRSRLWVSGRSRNGSRPPLVEKLVSRLQREWEDRFNATFPVFGSVKEFVYVANPAFRGDPEAPLMPVRAHGKRSRMVRSEDVGTVYLALDVIAHGWDAYFLDRPTIESRLYGVERAMTGIADAGRTMSTLREAVRLHAAVPNTLTADEERHLRELVWSGNIGSVPRHLKWIFRAVNVHSPESELAPRSSVTVVRDLIELLLDPDAMTRFASSGKTRALEAQDDEHEGPPRQLEDAGTDDRRPALTRQLVRRVGEELGYLGDRGVRDRPATASDSRLFWLVALILSRHHQLTARTLLTTLVVPALSGQPTLSGFVVELDEFTVRKTYRAAVARYRAKKSSEVEALAPS